jgi:hypothetical protein
MRHTLLTVIPLGKIECPMPELFRGGERPSYRFDSTATRLGNIFGWCWTVREVIVRINFPEKHV